MPVLIFALGLVIGSFLNALIYRLSTSSRSIFDKHSICPRCKHALAWPDLIPVASFFILGGRCRYCKKKISIQYPLVEIATAVAFVLIYNRLGIIDYRLLFQLAFASWLIVIFVYDLKHYLILDRVVYPAAGLALIYQGYQGDLGNALLGAALLAGFFATLYYVSRGRWIGFGDVKLGLFLGLAVPFPETLALFLLAYFSGALVAVFLMLSGAKNLKDRLPFGTFLTFAAFIAMLWGQPLVTWYFHLIGLS